MADQQPPMMPGVTPTMALPSADLITYRFDQIDKSMSAMNVKLDLLTSNFITRKEANLLIKQGEERSKEIDARFDSYQWYWRSLIVATISAVMIAIAGFFIHR